MNRFYLFLFSFLFLGCSTPTTYDQINQFLKTENSTDIKDFDHLVVINEMGGCITCSNRFAELMEEHIDNKSILFLICSSGSKIDVSAYLNREVDNIVYDFRNKFATLNIVNHCSIISLDEEKSCAVTEIDVNNLNESMIKFKNSLED